MVLLFRTIILYAIVVCVMRIMGKRQIGELQPFELVIAIMLSELAAVPMQDTGIPLLHGIIPILTLMLLQITLTLATLRFQHARRIICGVPSILIQSGRIMEEEMTKQRLNLDDLMEDLRLSGFLNISEIEYAILENSGKLSIIPKFNSAPVVRQDLSKTGTDDSLPIGLILDGRLNQANLSISGYDEQWLMNQLKDRSITNASEVFIAMLDSKRNLYVQRKDDNEK